MAEVAASLIGIATFGVSLTTTLYEFGATAAGAKEQTDFVARHIRLFGDTLELLGHQIDEDQPIHSHKALDLVYEIEDQSYELFYKIQDLLPNRDDRMSFMQKIKWNFRRSKVEVLVAELEYLKSTVNLLVTVLYAGKRIRFHRRRKQNRKAKEDINIQCAKVQNAIIEQYDAASIKEDLETQVHEEDKQSAASNNQRQAVISKSSATTPLAGISTLAIFKKSLGRPNDASDERALVVQGCVDLLTELLGQWTTLADDHRDSKDQGFDEHAEPSSRRPSSEDRRDTRPDRPRNPVQKSQTMSRAENLFPSGVLSPQTADDSIGREVLTKAFLEARESQSRMAEELEKLKLEKRELEDRIKDGGQHDRSRPQPEKRTPFRIDNDKPQFPPDYGHWTEVPAVDWGPVEAFTRRLDAKKNKSNSSMGQDFAMWLQPQPHK